MNPEIARQNITHNENKLLSLQLLRCIAVVLVIHAHALGIQIHLNIGESFQQKFYFLEGFGAVGVDIFFVLSGFIMSLVANKYIRPYGFRDFLIKRLIRIVPVYWIATLTAIVLSIFTSNISSLTSVNSPNKFFLKSFLILPIFDNEYFRNSILVQGWTLSFELYFYIILAVFIGSKSKNVVFKSFFFITSLVFTGIMLPLGNNVILKFISNPINLEFGLGCVIGFIYSFKIKCSRFFFVIVTLISLITLGLTLLLGYGDIANHDNIVNGNLSLTRVIIWGIPCSLLVAGLVFLEASFAKSIPKVLVLIGDASYSIYLTQYLSLEVFSGIWKKLDLGYPDIFILVSIVFSVVTGSIFYSMIEKRLINYLNFRYNCFCQRRKSNYLG